MILGILATFLGGFKFFPFYYASTNRRFDKKRSMWQNYVFDEKLKYCIWKDDFVRNKPKKEGEGQCIQNAIKQTINR